EDQCERTFFQLVYSIVPHDIHPSSMINADQPMIYMGPGGTQYTYAEKGSKQVSLYGLEEKCGFTSFLAVMVEGLVLDIQSIWCGKTAASLPKCLAWTAAKAVCHIFSWNTNSHWSNVPTIQEFFEQIIKPHRQKMINKQHLPNSASTKSIIFFDCWQVHRSSDMLDWLKTIYDWLITILVRARCTGVFQPCDVGLQHVYKHII
ncbi:hypothetical protein BDD12DRAFT_739920, partial [Trichophaea hybrida]